MHERRVELVPLTVDDADGMVEVLGGDELYAFIGGTPPTADELRARYARLEIGRSDDGSEEWLNWIIRRIADGKPVGTVQATVVDDSAEIAWVVGLLWQGNGYATEAATALVGLLDGRGITRVTAHVHPDHHASAAVARRIGLEPTDEFHEGERRWQRVR